MTTAQQLQVVFQELDYLDDGYEDGLISHVGLRRIILETPEVEADLGTTFTRALLARSEQNIYGRLTFEEFLLLAREVAVYTHNYNTANRQARQGGLPQHYSQQQLVGGSQDGSSPVMNGGNMNSNYRRQMAPKNAVHSAAVKLAIPLSEREERINYLDEYSCKPPPLFLICISLAQLGVFIWHVITLTNQGKIVGPDGPVYVTGYLIFNPTKKTEVWRFVTYMFVHSGYFHVTFNLLVQLILGIPLEMVHRWWRILLIYVSGVAAGSLATSVTDPDVYLAGASGGVYALIAAHLANVIFNWGEMEFPALRLLAFLLLAGVDTGVAIYYRYVAGVDTRVSYVAHLAGALVGLLLGIVVLRNLREHKWERVLWWFCLILFLILFLAAIIQNAVLIGLN